MFSFTEVWWKSVNPEQKDIRGWALHSSEAPYDVAANEEYW